MNDPGPQAPPAPEPGAPDEAMETWKEQQAAWKREHDAWRQQQAADLRAQQQRANAEQRRVNQEHAAEQRRIQLEREALTKPGAGYTLAAFGLALIAGAVTALWSAGFDWQVESKIVAAMSATLAVLALAVIVNGFRGRRSGGSGGLAVLVVIALVVAGFFGWVRGPIISTSTISWQPELSDTDTNRTVISGDVDLDLRDYFDGEDSGRGDLRLFVIAGDVDVTLPADALTELDVDVTSGAIRIDGEVADSGAFADASTEVPPRGDASDESRILRVDIYVVAGDVTVDQAR